MLKEVIAELHQQGTVLSEAEEALRDSRRELVDHLFDNYFSDSEFFHLYRFAGRSSGIQPWHNSSPKECYFNSFGIGYQKLKEGNEQTLFFGIYDGDLPEFAGRARFILIRNDSGVRLFLPDYHDYKVNHSDSYHRFNVSGSKEITREDLADPRSNMFPQFYEELQVVTAKVLEEAKRREVEVKEENEKNRKIIRALEVIADS